MRREQHDVGGAVCSPLTVRTINVVELVVEEPLGPEEWVERVSEPLAGASQEDPTWLSCSLSAD